MRRAQCVGALLLVLLAAPAGALPLVYNSQLRTIEAQAEAFAGPDHALQILGDQTDDVGPVSLQLDPIPQVSIAGASGHSQAGQITTLGPTAMDGGGGAQASAQIYMRGAIAESDSHAFLRVVFGVTNDAAFQLEVFLASSNGGVEGQGGTVFFSLSSLDAGADPLSILLEATPEIPEASTTRMGVFRAGIEYEILASADVFTEGVLSMPSETYEDAGFVFRLSDVPEPATACGLALGLMWLSTVSRRR